MDDYTDPKQLIFTIETAESKLYTNYYWWRNNSKYVADLEADTKLPVKHIKSEFSAMVWKIVLALIDDNYKVLPLNPRSFNFTSFVDLIDYYQLTNRDYLLELVFEYYVTYSNIKNYRKLAQGIDAGIFEYRIYESPVVETFDPAHKYTSAGYINNHLSSFSYPPIFRENDQQVIYTNICDEIKPGFLMAFNKEGMEPWDIFLVRRNLGDTLYVEFPHIEIFSGEVQYGEDKIRYLQPSQYRCICVKGDKCCCKYAIANRKSYRAQFNTYTPEYQVYQITSTDLAKGVYLQHINMEECKKYQLPIKTE